MKANTIVQAAPSLPRLVGLAEAAQALSISRAGLYRYLAPGGGLSSVKLGRRRLVSINELVRFVAEREAASA